MIYYRRSIMRKIWLSIIAAALLLPLTAPWAAAQGNTKALFLNGLESRVFDSAKKAKIDALGFSVWASPDFNVMVTGAPFADFEKAGKVGMARLYEMQGKKSVMVFLIPQQYQDNMLFGSAVAGTPDGKTVVVGAPGGATDVVGRAFVYTRPKEGWNPKAEKIKVEFEKYQLGAPDESKADRKGRSVAISDDGKYVLLGAPGKNKGQGGAYLYNHSTGNWSGKGKIGIITLGVVDPKPGDEFGQSVAMTRDGSILLFGAPGYDKQRGAAYLFLRPKSGNWGDVNDIKVIPIKPSGLKGGERFGTSVAISKDGKIFAVSCPGYNNHKGTIALFGYDKKQNKFTFNFFLQNTFDQSDVGSSLAFSKDGKTLVTGTGGKDYSGGLMSYVSTKGFWEKYTYQGIAYNTKGVLAGFSVALAADGKRIVFGVPLDKKGAGDWSVYTFKK